MPNHILNAQQFSRRDIDALFDKARSIREALASGTPRLTLTGKILATLFFEPSTRTRLSFESAMLGLGGTVISTENAREFSSAVKGETLEDTIRVVEHYADAIVLRHHEAGAADRAAHVSAVPIINAGDGAGQHPTQALLDLFTIEDELGAIDGTTITLVGDLLYGRTVRSLSYLLAKNYSVKKIFLVAPEPVRMRSDILAYLKKRRVDFEETENLERVLPLSDVVYQTRIQKERFGDRAEDYERSRGIYIVNAKTLARMPRNSIVMHPLPRVDEIHPEIDTDPRAAYFRQARNGRLVRMAILDTIING